MKYTFTKEELLKLLQDEWSAGAQNCPGTAHNEGNLDVLLKNLNLEHCAVTATVETSCGYCGTVVGDSALCEGCGSDWSGNFVVSEV